MEAFGKHIMAIAKFIQLRGPSQFHTTISAGLLGEIRRLVASILRETDKSLDYAKLLLRRS
jgi:hypothetical protein